MTEVVVAGAIILIVVLFVLDRVMVAFGRERVSWGDRVDALVAAASAERATWAEERRELLNRIQHPERIPVTPGPYVPSEPPRDPSELAQVGQLVPEFITVGSAEQMLREEQEIAKVGTVVDEEA